MEVCDYSRSFFTFRVDMRKRVPITVSQPPPLTVNNARCPLEARCRIRFAQSGKAVEYVVSAACKAEQVNVTKGIWHQPNADMCMVASDEHFMVVKSWDRTNKGVKLYPPSLGDQPERQVGRIADAFDHLRVDLCLSQGRVLETTDEIVTAILANRRLVGQTDFTTSDGSTVSMEYPIKVVNASEVDGFYQTDTGPILWPDAAGGWSENPISTFRLAFIAHNAPDWAELIVNVPTPVAEGIAVNHYSRVQRLEGVTNRMIELP